MILSFLCFNRNSRPAFLRAKFPSFEDSWDAYNKLQRAIDTVNKEAKAKELAWNAQSSVTADAPPVGASTYDDILASGDVSTYAGASQYDSMASYSSSSSLHVPKLPIQLCWTRTHWFTEWQMQSHRATEKAEELQLKAELHQQLIEEAKLAALNGIGAAATTTVEVIDGAERKHARSTKLPKEPKPAAAAESTNAGTVSAGTDAGAAGEQRKYGQEVVENASNAEESKGSGSGSDGDKSLRRKLKVLVSGSRSRNNSENSDKQYQQEDSVKSRVKSVKLPVEKTDLDALRREQERLGPNEEVYWAQMKASKTASNV